MTPEFPPNPRAEKEARLTAYLLGELPAHEAAAVRLALDEDAELAQLCERLKPVIKLVRATAVEPATPSASPSAPLKLSDDRRQKLLAHFKTIMPKEFAPPPKREPSMLLAIAAIAVTTLLLAGLLLPSLAKSKAKAYSVSIASNLRQIEVAKRMWADDNNKSATDVPTPEDLKPYMGRGVDGNLVKPLAGESYVLGAVGEAPTAELDVAKARKMFPSRIPAKPPAGGPSAQRMRLSIDGQLAYADQSKVANGRGEMAEREVAFKEKLAPPPPPVLAPPPASVAAPLNPRDTTTIVLPSSGEPSDSTTLTVNGWKFPTNNPNNGYLGRVSQPSGTPESGTEAGANKSSSSPTHGNRDWVADLNLPPGRADGSNNVIGGYVFGSNTLYSERVVGYVAVSPSALTNSVALNPTHPAHFGLDEAEPDAARNPSQFAEKRSQIDVAADGAELVKQISNDLNNEQFLAVQKNALLTRSTTLVPNPQNFPQSQPPQQAQKSGELLADNSSRPSVISGNGNIQKELQPGSAAPAQRGGGSILFRNTSSSPIAIAHGEGGGRAGNSSSNANSPDVAGSNANSTSRLATDEHTRRTFYRDSNSNGSLDQGVAQKNEAASNSAYTQNVVGYVNVGALTGRSLVGVETEDREKANKELAETPAKKGKIELAAVISPVAKAMPLDASGNDDIPAKKPAAPAPIPQPEVPTSENSFSTFSLNVSDVSFKLAAASLEKGQTPEPAGIRSEEFINAFNYRDPDPAPGAPIGFAWERAHDPFAQNRDFLRFSVKTAAAGREPGRPLNIVLLLDNSGSMERADRVQIIHEALRVLATQLQPQDKLSVVTFARTARLWVDGISGSEAAAVTDRVSNLTPEGGTNLEEAMRLAYETAHRHYLPDGINRVVLLTDGAANLGNVEPAALKQKAEQNRKQGIALDCFGIGWEGYNDDLLEVLARNGDGRYGFLNTPEEASADFAGQLAGALHVAASDVKVQVEFNPKRVTAYRQIGYAKHQLTKAQFRDNTVNAAQIGAAESGNALYTIAVNPSGEGPLGTVRVRFRVPGTSNYQEHAWEVPYTGTCPSLDLASPAMRLATTAAAFAESLADSPYAIEVTSDKLLGYLRGVPEVYGADARPKKLEWMIRQVKSLSGK